MDLKKIKKSLFLIDFMYNLCYTYIVNKKGEIEMKKEIKKVEKLINKKGYIPILSGNDILFIFNKETGKEYRPKYNLMLGGM